MGFKLQPEGRCHVVRVSASQSVKQGRAGSESRTSDPGPQGARTRAPGPLAAPASDLARGPPNDVTVRTRMSAAASVAPDFRT